MLCSICHSPPPPLPPPPPLSRITTQGPPVRTTITTGAIRVAFDRAKIRLTDFKVKINPTMGSPENAYRVEWEHKDGWAPTDMAKLMNINVAGDMLKLEVSKAYSNTKNICMTCLKITAAFKGATEDNHYCGGHDGGGTSVGAYKKASNKRAGSAFDERNRKRIAAAANAEF